jgi:hypothetical protein
LASGDPLILDLARAQNELTRLQRVHRAFNRAKSSLTDTITASTSLAEARTRQIAAVAEAMERRTDTQGDRFRMTVDGHQVDSRSDAGELLVRWAQTTPANKPRPVGQLGGLEITGTVIVDRYDGTRAVRFELHDLPAEKAQRTVAELVAQPVGMVRQLEHRVATLPELKVRLGRERAAALEEGDRARETLARPFKHADALRDAGEEVKRIKAQMRATDERPPTPPQPAPSQQEPSPPAATAPDSSQAERITTTLGQDRAGRLLRARIALKERFAHPTGADGALSWQDPQARDCYRQITTIADAARRDPADRSTLSDQDDHALKQLADQALTAARALYRTGPQTPGSAHHAAQRDQPHHLGDSPDSGPGLGR